jgi:CBS domain-containing protein
VVISIALFVHSSLVVVDSYIAPLWEPSNQMFIAMLSTTDFLDTIRLCLRSGIRPLDVVNKSIRDVLHTAVGSFSHSTFQTVDAEDTVYEMCKSLQQFGNDFVPIIDSSADDGSLVATLGYCDIVNLMFQAAAQHPHLFQERIESLKCRAQLSSALKSSPRSSFSGTSPSKASRANESLPLPSITVPQTMLLGDVLNLMYDKELSGVPVVDDNGRVIGIYHKEDLSFISSATPDAVDMIINGSLSIQVGEIVKHQTDDSSTVPHKLCTCTGRDTIKEVLDTMMSRRVTRVVCIDDDGRCSSMISIADIVWYFFD